MAGGRKVIHPFGWRERSVVPEAACEPVPDGPAPIQRYLGHLGIPGQTAYFRLLDAAAAAAGDVLFVSAAAGAVGSAVVQIARIKRLTVIASADGAEKCAVLRFWGAHATVDRRAPGTMREKLAAAAPDGITV